MHAAQWIGGAWTCCNGRCRVAWRASSFLHGCAVPQMAARDEADAFRVRARRRPQRYGYMRRHRGDLQRRPGAKDAICICAMCAIRAIFMRSHCRDITPGPHHAAQIRSGRHTGFRRRGRVAELPRCGRIHPPVAARLHPPHPQPPATPPDPPPLAQPAFSRRIDKLEQALGVRLLDRSTRRVTLTAVGRDFARKTRLWLDELDGMLMGLGDVAARRMGEVTIACVPSAVYYFLPQVVKRYHERFPKIRVKVHDASANEVLVAVAQGEADFGLNFIGSQEAEIEFKPVL